MKPPKRLSPAKLQAMVDDFNSRFPVGTAVLRFPSTERISGEGKETKTLSPAWVMGGHSAMVMLEGVSGGYSLDCILVN
jgi:hypothetical protein